MPEQANTRARHQAILATANKHLKQGDTSAYWKAISEISPRYARLAGQVADDKGFIGTGARERLQDAAEESRGRRFTKAELDQIEVEIATSDHRVRQENLKDQGTAGVSLRDTDEYHTAIFKDRDLPPDTYTLHNMVKSLGPVADAVRDTDDPKDPADKARFDEAVKQHKPELSEQLRKNIDVAGDGLSFISDVVEGYAHDFKDWTDDRQREVREMFDGKLSPSENEPKSGLRTENEADQTERKKLVENLTKQDNPLEEILDKDPADLTEGELREVMGARRKAKTDAEREKLFGIEKAFFEDKFGTGDAEFDFTGKMIDAPPIKPTNKTPVPAQGRDGKPVAETLKRLAQAVTQGTRGDGPVEVVKALQNGLNLLNRARTEKLAKKQGKASPLFSELKDDGDPGPKTRAAFKRATANLGPAKIKEGMALGRFKRLAEKPAFGDLRQQTEGAFGNLFRRPSATAKPRIIEEGFGLQATINDLGRDTLGNGFKAIKEDGDIGPKTEAAFGQVLPAAGNDNFTSKLGENLGFFDDDDELFG